MAFEYFYGQIRNTDKVAMIPSRVFRVRSVNTELLKSRDWQITLFRNWSSLKAFLCKEK